VAQGTVEPGDVSPDLADNGPGDGPGTSPDGGGDEQARPEAVAEGMAPEQTPGNAPSDQADGRPYSTTLEDPRENTSHDTLLKNG
jgi:hypothetical protein